MKHYMLITLLTATFTLLPAEQAVTGKALKKAYKEYDNASKESEHFELNEQLFAGQLDAYNKVLRLLNAEGATKDSVKSKVQREKDQLDAILNKREKDRKKLAEESALAYDNLTSLINEAAKKLG